MNVADLLSEAQALGIVLRADGDRLRFRPVEAVTPDLRAKLVAAKPALLRLLAGHGLQAEPMTAAESPGGAPAFELPRDVAERVAGWLAAASANRGAPTTFYADDLRGWRDAIRARLRAASARVYVFDSFGVLRFTVETRERSTGNFRIPLA